MIQKPRTFSRHFIHVLVLSAAANSPIFSSSCRKNEHSPKNTRVPSLLQSSATKCAVKKCKWRVYTRRTHVVHTSCVRKQVHRLSPTSESVFFFFFHPHSALLSAVEGRCSILFVALSEKKEVGARDVFFFLEFSLDCCLISSFFWRIHIVIRQQQQQQCGEYYNSELVCVCVLDAVAIYFTVVDEGGSKC